MVFPAVGARRVDTFPGDGDKQAVNRIGFNKAVRPKTTEPRALLTVMMSLRAFRCLRVEVASSSHAL